LRLRDHQQAGSRARTRSFLEDWKQQEGEQPGLKVKSGRREGGKKRGRKEGYDSCVATEINYLALGVPILLFRI
jgi:hypothetical protein